MNDKMIKYLFDMIRLCPFVAENKAYTESANNTTPVFEEDDTVNAYAYTEYAKNHISMMAGICNVSLVGGYALATRDLHTIKDTMVSASRICHSNKGNFSYMDAIKCINGAVPKITEKVRLDGESFAYGCLISVMAHELGHICLHHTIQTHSGDGHTNAISRNNERCADLFAASVVETTPFAGYMIPADLMANVYLAWLSDDSRKATTHPYARERAEYIYNSHVELLGEYGITKEVFDAIMPPKV